MVKGRQGFRGSQCKEDNVGALGMGHWSHPASEVCVQLCCIVGSGFVCWGYRNKRYRLGDLTEICFSPFWRLEVPDGGVGRVAFLLTLLCFCGRPYSHCFFTRSSFCVSVFS